MTDGLFSALEAAPPNRAGYRLHHLEVFNWGTFDARVWRLTPDGETALLTGDIGSGKSTLVDAVTTLLLPANRIAYNKAAGADTKERTLRSYVEGHYKSERIESTGSSRAVGLRDHRSYSVILGVFTNAGFDETVSIAQVFHQRDRSGQPDRFFVTSAKELSIDTDFTRFGADLGDLRKRLRAGGAAVSTVFPDYARQVRRMLGIRSEQAMDLFHQTVSMKSVGNLNDFVRNHMLEPVDAAEKIDGIVAHFDDLSKAHAAVRRAKDQLAALEPLVATASRYDAALARRSAAQRQHDAIAAYFAELRIRLWDEEIDRNRADRADRQRAADEVSATCAGLTRDRERLLEQRAAAGGDRLADIDRLAEQATAEAAARRDLRERFDQQLADAGLNAVEDAETFGRLPAQVNARLEVVRDEQAELRTRVDQVSVRSADVQRRSAEIRGELDSLRGRRSNLPSNQLELRERLCTDLDIDPGTLPFAGELIDVAEEFEQWRGAAERVLRGFALSLLVPQQHYSAVSRWVNEHRLTVGGGRPGRDEGRPGMRLVYERVPDRQVRLQPAPPTAQLQLAHTLDVAPGPFAAYLRDQLGRRADHLCAATLAEFQQANRAVTVQGQVRSGDRHEKDDRSRVDDPRTWVLGWANERKIDALVRQLADLQETFVSVQAERAQLDRERIRVEAATTVLAKLEEYRGWPSLDWQEAAARAEALRSERARLLAGSTRLAEIDRGLAENTAARTTADDRLDQLTRRVHGLTALIDRAEDNRGRDVRRIAALDPAELAESRETYPVLDERLGGTKPTSPDAVAEVESDLGRQTQHEIERIGREIGGYATSLTSAMDEVRRRWPEATTEMDTSVDSRGEFVAFRDRVAQDDLPAFEVEFKRQLNTNTIRELAGFNSWLRRQADEIHARVSRINEALGAIDYSPGRYIALVAERTVNQEVQAFRRDLRAATDNTLGDDSDQYSEQRFLDVQRIIERFSGRVGHADTDKAWTRRVTDVRNWFTFSASERDRDTDDEWEHYQDSDGKSGGQKEKLAYTILAASLAYQFGLEWGVERSKDFRFAVIDEAFGRGSDVSTRYALDLFAKLGLQLLIVTPLQKVHIIEPYVQAIGFVDNTSGKSSRLHTMTIEEYRARRDAGPTDG